VMGILLHVPKDFSSSFAVCLTYSNEDLFLFHDVTEL
jgi:hypothetical protein